MPAGGRWRCRRPGAVFGTAGGLLLSMRPCALHCLAQVNEIGLKWAVFIPVRKPIARLLEDIDLSGFVIPSFCLSNASDRIACTIHFLRGGVVVDEHQV